MVSFWSLIQSVKNVGKSLAILLGIRRDPSGLCMLGAVLLRCCPHLGFKYTDEMTLRREGQITGDLQDAHFRIDQHVLGGFNLPLTDAVAYGNAHLLGK